MFEIAVFAGSGNRIVGLRDIPTSLVLMVTMMNDHVSSWHISLSLSACAGPSGGSRLAEASSTISHTKSHGRVCGDRPSKLSNP